MAKFSQHLRKHQHFYPAVQILDLDKGHRGIVFGGFQPDAVDNTEKRHVSTVMIPVIFPVSLGNFADLGSVKLCRRLGIGGHRMPGKIHAGDLLFHGQ